MTKFLRAKKSKYFEFSLLDESTEFNEFFDYVFERRNSLFFVFNNSDFTDKEIENIKSNVIYFYVNQRGWKNAIFLKSL